MPQQAQPRTNYLPIFKQQHNLSHHDASYRVPSPKLPARTSASKDWILESKTNRSVPNNLSYLNNLYAIFFTQTGETNIQNIAKPYTSAFNP